MVTGCWLAGWLVTARLPVAPGCWQAGLIEIYYSYSSMIYYGWLAASKKAGKKDSWPSRSPERQP